MAVADLLRRAAALDAAWAGDPTFLIDSGGIVTEPAGTALAQLPSELCHGHFVLMTSGSTGAPKAIVGSKARAQALARALTAAQDSAAVGEVILALPLHYSFALVNQWLWSRVEDRPLRITEGFAAPELLLSALECAQDAMLCLVGVHVPLLERFFGAQHFDGVTRLHFAGGRFPQESVPRLRQLFPNARVFNNYGCAEAMPRLTLRPADASDDAANIGRPLPGIELDSTTDGALVFRSPYGAVGFVEDDLWHPIEPSDWVATGDLGEQIADGSWRLSGRASEVFKRHGEKVSIPAVLESVFTKWAGQAGCYTAHDPSGEQGYVLVLAPSPAAGQVRDLLGALRSHPRSSWPLRIESRDTLPLLPNGKVDARALQQGSDVHWHQRI